MIRFLLWIFVIYVVWKVFEVFVSSRHDKRTTRTSGEGAGKPGGDFSQIEDAEFEDITKKQPPPEEKPS